MVDLREKEREMLCSLAAELVKPPTCRVTEVVRLRALFFAAQVSEGILLIFLGNK